MISSLDEKAEFSEKDIKHNDELAHDGSKNMDNWMHNFSTKHEIPSVYIIDSIFYDPDTNFMFQYVKYVYPNAKRARDNHDKLMVFDHSSDPNDNDDCKVLKFKEVYNNLHGTYLRLIKIEHNNFHTVRDEVYICDTENLTFEFSEDSKMLAIMWREDQTT